MPKKPAWSREKAEKVSEEVERMWQIAQEQGFTEYQEIAEVVGKSPGHIGKVLKGDRPVSEKLRRAFAHAFGTTAQWLRTGTGPRTVTSERDYEARDRSFPLVGRAAADSSEGQLTSPVHPEGEYDIGADRVMVEIIGDSLAPVALDGQYVIVDTSMRSPRAGDLVVCETTDGDVYAKRAFPRNGNGLELVSVNPLHRERMIVLKPEQIKRVFVIVGVWFE